MVSLSFLGLLVGGIAVLALYFLRKFQRPAGKCSSGCCHGDAEAAKTAVTSAPPEPAVAPKPPSEKRDLICVDEESGLVVPVQMSAKVTSMPLERRKAMAVRQRKWFEEFEMVSPDGTIRLPPPEQQKAVLLRMQEMQQQKPTPSSPVEPEGAVTRFASRSGQSAQQRGRSQTQRTYTE
eukprot:TRINITY_DN14675_c0_g1_i1.p1 TRINITY_DN14675_c0_g1~~TRINITY_DN14675_c0_g1_i1.p1  ORF type:complete len:179 (+),score=69.22 TRINITY_DN14675_c0_g1_i1:130-666(+)